MSLNFPNPSRSYYATRRAVRFWGHDSSMESTFYIAENALKGVQPDMKFDEASILLAFDLNRELIHAAAVSAYERERRTSYDLVAADFK